MKFIAALLAACVTAQNRFDLSDIDFNEGNWAYEYGSNLRNLPPRNNNSSFKDRLRLEHEWAPYGNGKIFIPASSASYAYGGINKGYGYR